MRPKLREKFKEKRRSLSKKDVMEKSIKIFRNLLNQKHFKQASVINTYISFKNEVKTQPILNHCFGNDKRVCVPSKRGNLLYTKCEKIRRGDFGCPEPKTKKTIGKEKIDLVLVPGLVFDQRGHRIGYGNGFYDKFLSNIKAEKIGLAYNFQLIEKIPKEEHDQKLGMVVTEEKVYRF